MTPDEMEAKLGQAYQVIGAARDASDEELARALDYFSSDEYDAEFLPWPKEEK
jgi:uncharacterized damage-inducible protein DinB